MNAHHETYSCAFGLPGLLLAQNHRSDAFSTLYKDWTYTWNYLNEMTGFSEKNSSGTVIASGTYTYDSLDRRIGVDETSGGTTTQTWIVYNGDSNTPYAQFNGSGTLLERYLAGPSYVPGVTGMIARTNASGVTDWYLTGKLGSVRDIVNTSGTVIDHISYGAFGSIRAETNPSSGSQFKFDGMQYDSITGLYNDWHRVYTSTDGRFLSLDPLTFKSNSVNLFMYVSNSPELFSDPSGFRPPKGKNDSGGFHPDKIYGPSLPEYSPPLENNSQGSQPSPPAPHIGNIIPTWDKNWHVWNYPAGYYNLPRYGNVYYPNGFYWNPDKSTNGGKDYGFHYPSSTPFWNTSDGTQYPYWTNGNQIVQNPPLMRKPFHHLRQPGWRMYQAPPRERVTTISVDPPENYE